MAEKILLVDDDSNILDGYRRSLSREFLLETAIGGEEALKLATDNGPYAVVVSDMRMPGMDGIQLLSQIKAQSPDTIRVMLTGNTEIDTAIRLPRSARDPRDPFQRLDGPVSRQQRHREPVELLPFNMSRSIIERAHGDKIIDGQSDVGLQSVESFLGNPVERGLRVLAFKTSQDGEDNRTQDDTNGDDA